MSKHVQPQTLFTKYTNEIKPTLDKLYSDGLQQYSDWMGDNFYPIFGITDHGQAKADDLPSDPTEKQVQYFNAANDLATRLNNLNTQIFDAKREENNSLASGNWPGSDFQKYNYNYYEQSVVPVLVAIVTELRQIQENILISQPDGFNNSWGVGPFAFGQSPPENLPELIDDVFDVMPEFLNLFGVQVSFKKEIPQGSKTATVGSTTIISDVDLESSLGLSGTDATHYIGMLEPASRSDDKRSKDYLPCRLSPGLEENVSGWHDLNYSLVTNNGNLVNPPGTNKLVDGVEIPLGLEITVVDIVPSETGLWVGFVSLDPKLREDVVDLVGNPSPAEQADGIGFKARWDFLITKNQSRIIYTKAEYVRIKDSALASSPDPYISEKILLGQRADSVGNTIDSAISIKGSERVDPENSQTWIKLDPEEVVLKYYDFESYNSTVIGKNGQVEIFYNPNSFSLAPTLKLSQGFYYFIAGETRRPTEAELIDQSTSDIENSEQAITDAKNDAASNSMSTIKDTAWKNLLKYFNKQEANTSHLFDKHFILVDKKLNANEASPNNQKGLFAIRASYIDSLPENVRSYTNNFDNDDPFYGGRSYAVSMPMNEFSDRVAYLSKTLKEIKAKADESNATIENASGLEFDLETQIQALEDLPNIFDAFFARQAYPMSTNRDTIHQLASTGLIPGEDGAKHIIQIGLTDNKEIGANVRETVSYILFSPDPDSLPSDGGSDDIDIFSFDPYLTEEELSAGSGKEVRRSAIALQIGLPILRRELSGAYSSRALHLLLAHDKIKNRSSATGGDSELKNNWRDFFSSFFVPPVKIYLSKDPSLVSEPKLTCKEIIDQLNRSGPTIGMEEKLLQEELYSRPECMEEYFKENNKKTPASSPEFSKQQLELKSDLGKIRGKFKDNEYLRTLYTQFFNVIDFESIMAMIMACLYKELGIQFTAEGICEAAIIELIKSTGSGPIEQAMLAAALLSPDSQASIEFFELYENSPSISNKDNLSVDDEGPDGIVIDPSFNGMPIATSMKMSPRPPALSIINITKEMEAAKQFVNLVPGPRPDGDTQIQLPFGASTAHYLGIGEAGGYTLLPEFYTEQEIERAKQRLLSKGFSEDQARAELVRMGYLVPDQAQFESLIGSENFSSAVDKGLSNFQFKGIFSESAGRDVRIAVQAAEDWLAYAKQFMSIQSICELLVGEVLEGLKELLKDPGAFFDGGGEAWWDSFVEKLKKQFIPKPLTFKFPDKLPTDSHMGDYEKALLKAILSMVGLILGQIVDLLIKDALEKCLEENKDTGPAGQPPNKPESIPFPVLSGSDLPKLDGVPDVDIVAWMKDTIDNLQNNSILCALLRGDATKFTLKQILTRTEQVWPEIYAAGIDTIYEIRVAFKKIGDSLDLDICNFVDPLNQLPLVDDLCDAAFDRDARCEQLKLGGLTEEECQEQIDKELQELRQKVIGLTSLSLFGADPLKDSFPPICGDGGSFKIPPGVEDSMQRITDNMLNNVKGSLLIDMNSLKFFSTPPKGLLAATDPEALVAAHDMFVQAITEPYKKNCLALIADPSRSDLYNLNTTSGTKTLEIYPITYNRYFHYGNCYTRFSGSDFEGEDTFAFLTEEEEQEINDLAREEVERDALLKRSIYLATQEALFAQELRDLLEDIIDREIYLINEQFDGSTPERRQSAKDQLHKIEQLKEKVKNLIEFIEAPSSVGVGAGNVEGSIFSLPHHLSNITSSDDDEGKRVFDKISNFRDKVLVEADKIYNDFIVNFLDSRIVALTGQKILEKQTTLTSIFPKEFIEKNILISDEDLASKAKSYLIDRNRYRVDEDFFDKREVVPIHYGCMLKGITNPELNLLATTIPANTDAEKTKKDYFLGFLSDVISRQPIGANAQDVVDEMYSEFTSDLQSRSLENLIIGPEDLYKPRVLNKNKNGLFNIANNSNKNFNFPGNIDSRSNPFAAIKKTYGLNEKLIDISNDVDNWYIMLAYYTGLKIDFERYNFPIPLLNAIDATVFDSEDASTVIDSLSEVMQNNLKFASHPATFEALFLEDNFDDLFLALETFSNISNFKDAREEFQEVKNIIASASGTTQDSNTASGALGDIQVEDDETAIQKYRDDNDIEDDISNSDVISLAKQQAINNIDEETKNFLKGRLEELVSWYNWIVLSPGLRNLIPIMKTLRERDPLDDGKATTISGGFSRGAAAKIIQTPFTKSGGYNILRAFQELTVAEATGLEMSKIKKIFPNIKHLTPETCKVVFTALPGGGTAPGYFHEGDKGPIVSVFKYPEILQNENESSLDLNDFFIDSNLAINLMRNFFDDEDRRHTYKPLQILPHFISFEKVFRDPGLPFNQDDGSIIDYFSMKDDLVNKELYDYLNNRPESIGYGNDPATQQASMYSDISKIENDLNFNPNILSYNLPFTEVLAPGGQDVASKITDIFSNISTPGDQIDVLVNNLNITREDSKLINQNVVLPLSDNHLAQGENIVNASLLLKAKVPQANGRPASPPNVLVDVDIAQDKKYNFNFTKNLPKDVQELINGLYTDSSAMKSMLSNYDSVFSRTASEKNLLTPKFSRINNPRYFQTVDPYNFKAQIFGRFLTKKFFEKFDEFFYAPNASNITLLQQDRHNIERNMNYILSTYGYTSLQYAYVNQAFSKLKHSRLHRRGFMRSLWKKVLKTTSTSEIDPRCQLIFDKVGAASTKDLDKTETDFFNLDVVKPKILNFYKQSLCKDIYETSPDAAPSARLALIEGMIIMIAKIYSLEMCLSALISWDSFNIEDVFSDDALKTIVIENIKKDYDIVFLAAAANDIISKQNIDLTLLELTKKLDGESAVESLISEEIVSISKVINEMFLNSNPLTTELSVTTLKNSDPDFVEEYERIFDEGERSISGSVLSEIHAQTGIEYVVHASMENNIYTMNFGDGQPPDISPLSALHNQIDQQYTSARLESDIYGYFHGRKRNNKNYFHSLAQNYYQNITFDFHDVTNTQALAANKNYSEEAIPATKNLSVGSQDMISEQTYYAQNKEKYSGFKVDLFNFENFQEFTVANELNSRFGNVIFQPYVKIDDYSDGEERENFVVDLYSDYEKNGVPCHDATLFASYDINDFLELLQDLESARNSNNILNCYMRGYVPLSSWSYYYSSIFLPFIENYRDDEGRAPLKMIFEAYGLKPFYKKVSFGVRMTYVNSYSLGNTEGLNLNSIANSAFGTSDTNTLKEAKCLFTQRPSVVRGLTELNSMPVNEVQIPIVEVEREIINSPSSPGSFTLVDKKGITRSNQPFSMELLGMADDNVNRFEKDADINTIISTPGQKHLKHLAYNFKQFFYGNLSNDLMTDIQKTAEFKLMYEYLFPMKRYMALPFIVSSEGLSKFIPEPTDVLEETKKSIKTIIQTLANSADYKSLPDPVANLLKDMADKKDMGTTGKEDNLTKEILRIIFRTPMLILKGFVEVTDPAIIIAKAIIDISNTIVFTTLAAIKTAVQTAETIIDTGIMTAKQVMTQFELQLAMSLEILKGLKAGLGPAQDSVVIDVESTDPIEDWKPPKLEIKELPAEASNQMTDEQLDSWDSFKEQFEEMQKVIEEYNEAAETLKKLEEEKRKLVEYKNGALKEAEKELKAFFKSPFLLPGLWAALIPSMMPYLGGIVPPPFPGGPPSTIPGMIYLVLLLIDAIEEKQHDDMQKLEDDPNCEDQL